jgi:hypothetical protein
MPVGLVFSFSFPSFLSKSCANQRNESIDRASTTPGPKSVFLTLKKKQTYQEKWQWTRPQYNTGKLILFETSLKINSPLRLYDQQVRSIGCMVLPVNLHLQRKAKVRKQQSVKSKMWCGIAFLRLIQTQPIIQKPKIWILKIENTFELGSLVNGHLTTQTTYQLFMMHV